MDNLKQSISSCLEKQLNELELLKSMYPGRDEIVITDRTIIEDIQNFLDKKTECTPNHLDFVLNLFLDGMKLEVCINLPTFYPEVEPDIYVRCNQLNRFQEKNLNDALSEHIKCDSNLEEVCLYTAISWLQDNIESFSSKTDTKTQTNIREDTENVEDKFVRYWIYSHHIYNKKKREEISKRAKEMKLTGFCLPGKPGVICIEGMAKDCNDWWKDIKQMSWKKIALRTSEVFDLSEQKDHQKFSKFEEIIFQNSGASKHLARHADMSGFYKYLKDLGLELMYNNFFGLCES